jgi:hypothetical protein
MPEAVIVGQVHGLPRAQLDDGAAALVALENAG